MSTGPTRPIRNWLWARGFRYLFALDTLALYSTMVATNLVRFGTRWPTYSPGFYFLGFAIATGIQLTVNYFNSLYERTAVLGASVSATRVVWSMIVGTGISGLVALMFQRYLMPRANLIALAIVGSVLLTVNRFVALRLARRRMGPPRLLLVGPPLAIARARAHLAEIPPGRLSVVGEVTEPDELQRVAEELRPTDVLVLDLTAFEPIFPEPLTTLDASGMGIHQQVRAAETLLGLRRVDAIAGLPFTRIATHSMSPQQARLKRLFDLVVLTVFAVPILIVLGALWCYVRVRAGHPAIYRQTRSGLNSRPFTLYKFRTMAQDAERDGPQMATRDDARIIRGLGWMRLTRADELPQVLNVARGEMSLVGPRPERPELLAELERTVPGYARRHQVIPGLTGLAQVHSGYSTHPEHKLGYDLQYAVNWTLLSDVRILVRTAWTVIARRV